MSNLEEYKRNSWDAWQAYIESQLVRSVEHNGDPYEVGDILIKDGNEYQIGYITKRNVCCLDRVLHRSLGEVFIGGMQKLVPVNDLDMYKLID